MVVNDKKGRRALLVLLAGILFGALRAEEGSAQGVRQASSSAVNYNVTQSVEQLQMIVKSSRILTLDKPIPKFQVQNEQILSANPISRNQIQISALTPGITQLNMWDSDETLYTVDVIISADAREVEGILTTQFPGSSLKVTALSKGAVVSGSVTNVDDVDRAVQIVEQYYPEVVTNIRVVGVQQIMLHTKIMEVSRTKLRELGVDWALTDRANGTGIVLGTGGLVNTGDVGLAVDIGRNDLDGFLAALRQNELVKVLAEPTVVATHGRPARFIVGGKVPYIVPTGNGSVSVNYEEFGTSVDFMPFVVGPGRVRLEVRPEVSEPDPSRSITLQGMQIPAFRQRYVETAVEMDAGQTFALAGLLQSRVEANSRMTPFFGELPMVGSLFRRIKEQTNEIELLITVTPELAEAMDPCQVPPGGPGLNTTSPTDKELFHKGHIEVPRVDTFCPGGDEDCGPIVGEPVEVYGSGSEEPNFTFEHPDPSGYPYPPGPIVPGERPTHVAPGVMVVSPDEDSHVAE